MKTIQLCERCGNTGTYPAADGADDFDMEYCACPVGVKIENKESYDKTTTIKEKVHGIMKAAEELSTLVKGIRV